ncbi:SDR family NAD(P)-dependent oxidoreductase [Sphingomonas sp. BIUV-7]|uniref:SDR family NAD(P)-dependent oxidoreductase n=1 Tax=Sphingomonas natans TaxID=3063330 RepID=A0ABT8YAX7_9SPHN|nr:SDR family NAD(P)-dependent oxidoreductase [Sphingomonas sp. BIUV-7]MDO6414810.1 SDR family NAD(P)-dependent oxidoreductase [Sphingomonas sp. BIUV-7]
MTPEFGSPRTAIVTGGARRIGAAFVRALAEDGWTLLVHCYDSPEEAEEMVAGMPGARVVQADLGAPDCAETILGALEGMPPPALLVNNASRFELDQFDDFTLEGWDRHFLPNLRGPALLTRAFAQRVPAGSGALIVNMLDAKLAQPNPDFFTYTLSKYGLAALTELSARVLAERGIRVCAIAPSVTLVSGKQTRDNFDSVHMLNALRRGVTVDDLVAALRFLIASPAITGDVIRVDAGQRFLGLPRDVQFLDERS